MQIKFQADADLNGRIIRGLRRAAPALDIQTAHAARLPGVPDPQVLQIAADAGRFLISSDAKTMPGHFAEFVALHATPGVIVIRNGASISDTIDEILLLWAASDASEWHNQLIWIPL